LAARSGFTYEQNELFERNERRKGRSAKRMERKQRVMRGEAQKKFKEKIIAKF